MSYFSPLHLPRPVPFQKLSTIQILPLLPPHSVDPLPRQPAAQLPGSHIAKGVPGCDCTFSLSSLPTLSPCPLPKLKFIP